MREKIEKLALLPFAIGCMSESSVAVASPNQNEPRSKDDPGQLTMMGLATQKRDAREREEYSSDESTKSSFGFVPVPKPNITASIHRLYKGLKSFSQLFAYKEDADEDEDDDGQIEIGGPTDVKHVTHIGWDGCAAMTNVFGSPLSQLPLPLASHEVQTLS
ncbi:hypothetical protein MLD38_016830 [Melastoma candidum]|uniref:Uncharacterized protein n=1 Tax=Melastoma candidum TaxID=119954 RepID=A0ACB9QS59_9MYRT|nr:hypothetical protein MLD38_016830 [Melastoma candidum]